MRTRTLQMMLMAGLLAAALGAAPGAHATVQVVAVTPELADIARQVGGNRASVHSIAKPNQDYHMIEPRPSDVQKIARADMVARIGMDLDLWMDALLNAAANPKVSKGAPGYVDCSVGIKRLEVPREQITGASGDIHVYGNPHYFYDPQNGKIIAYNICLGLDRVSPSNAVFFNANYKRFIADVDDHIVTWQHVLAPCKGREVVIYHKSASYFLRRFGLKELGTLEVKPGIPPSAAHVRNLISQMKASQVRALVVESIYPRQFPDMVVRETGAKLGIVPYSVGSMGTRSYLDLIGMWVAKYKSALQ